MRLTLFDIDGTLLRCGSQVRDIFASALRDVYGCVGPLEKYSFAGRTDPGIVLDLMSGAGLERPHILDQLERMRELYLERLEEGLEAHRMRLLPGVLDLLETLAERADTVLGLLTGNWQLGARIKLSRFDLNRFFDFGAFGDDGADRRQLPPVALERARVSAGRTFTPEQTLIIGDSLLDVACGRAHGVPVMAVATGFTRAEDLADAGADWVLPDLVAAGFHLTQLATRRPASPSPDLPQDAAVPGSPSHPLC